MTESLWVTIFGAGGIGAVVLAIINGLFGMLSGKHEREKVRALTVGERIAQAEEREKTAHEDETEVRRELAYAYQMVHTYREHASVVRAICIQHGTPLASMPTWPIVRPYLSLAEDEKPDPQRS